MNLLCRSVGVQWLFVFALDFVVAAAEAPGSKWWRYDMTHQVLRHVSFTQFGDFDVDVDPSCQDQRLNLGSTDWTVVRSRVLGWLNLLDEFKAAALAKASGLGDGLVRGVDPRLLAGTVGRLGGESWVQVLRSVEADSSYSSFRNDCYFGHLAVVLCVQIVWMQVETAAKWSSIFRKVQLEVEAMIFFLEAPWSTVLRAYWHIPSLLSRLAQNVRSKAVAEGLRSGCDLTDTDEEDALYASVDPASGMLPPQVAEEYLFEHGQLNNWAIAPKYHQRCPLALAVAVMTLAAWINTGHATVGNNNFLSRMTPASFMDLYLTSILKLWHSWGRGQFFFDVLASRWEVFTVLEQLSLDWLPREEDLPRRPVDLEPLPVKRFEERYLSRRAWQMLPPPSFGLGCGLVGRRKEQRLRVLFLGGSYSTFKWTSFTQRGRQLARGLRSLGVDARAWNDACSKWCKRQPEAREGIWMPTAIVHVKHVCRCAMKLWRHVVHVYDPVDIIEWHNKLAAGNAHLGLDGILLTTSLAQKDVRTHPSIVAAGNMSVDWLPFHHSNFLELRIRDPSLPVRRVGVHTVHHDQEFLKLFRRSLLHLTNGTVPFVHLDPFKLFKATEGRMATPGDTHSIYLQLRDLDVAAVKQSGCVSEWWFCSRWRTGQRLLNHMSVGLPAIIWADAQGHLDLVQAVWPPTHGLGRERLEHLRCYPPELLVRNGAEAVKALTALLSNSSLRVAASECGLRIAAHFSLPRISWHLAKILRRLVRRKAARTPCWRRHVPGQKMQPY